MDFDTGGIACHRILLDRFQDRQCVAGDWRWKPGHSGTGCGRQRGAEVQRARRGRSERSQTVSAGSGRVFEEEAVAASSKNPTRIGRLVRLLPVVILVRQVPEIFRLVDDLGA